MAKLDGLEAVLNFLKGLQPKIAAQVAKKNTPLRSFVLSFAIALIHNVTTSLKFLFSFFHHLLHKLNDVEY